MLYFQIVYKVARMLIHTVYKHTKKTNKRCVIKNSTLIAVIRFHP